MRDQGWSRQSGAKPPVCWFFGQNRSVPGVVGFSTALQVGKS
jgi:hypothetical protein